MKTPSFCSAEYLEQHFKDWLKRDVRFVELTAVEAGIRAYVEKHPTVVERGDSWPQIRALAERNGFIKA